MADLAKIHVYLKAKIYIFLTMWLFSYQSFMFEKDHNNNLT